MATFIPGRNTAAEIGERFAEGAVKGYQQRSDERALQGAIRNLPADATPRQVIDAITGVNTYSTQAKQQAVKNFLDSFEMEESAREAQHKRENFGKLNPLQEAQKNLAEQRVKNLQEEENTLKSLGLSGKTDEAAEEIAPQTVQTGKVAPQEFNPQRMLNIPGISKPQATPSSQSQADMGEGPLANMSMAQLRAAAGFAGKNGRMGVIGNLAKGEIENRKEIENKAEKENIKQTVKRLYKDAGLSEEEAEKRKNDPLSVAQKFHDDVIEQKRKVEEKKGEPSQFEKAVVAEGAKTYSEAVNDVDNFKKNKAILEKQKILVNRLKGPKGYLQVLGQDAADLDANSNIAFQPIVKLYNPSGPIGIRKMEIIKEKYGITPWTLHSQALGKISAMEHFNDIWSKAAEKKALLYYKYNGNPPPDKLFELEEEEGEIASAMVDYPIEGYKNRMTSKEIEEEFSPKKTTEKTKYPTLPDPATKKGKTFRDPATMKYVISDGTQWLPKEQK